MPDGATILANITAGKTVLGRNNAFLRPMTFSNVPEIRIITAVALDLSARIIGNLEDAERELDFTNFARKVALYANRGGTHATEPNFLTLVCHAADFAQDKPRLMRSGILIPAIYAKAMEHRAQTAPAPKPNWRDEIQQMKTKASPPPVPVVWESESAHFRLHELIHPFHIWEEGVALKNCLCRINPWLPTTRVGADAPADLLWALDYWICVSSGDLALYSLRSGTTRFALLGISEGQLSEFKVVFPDDIKLPQHLVAVFNFLEARPKPLKLGTNRMGTRERAIVRNINAIRTAHTPTGRGVR